MSQLCNIAFVGGGTGGHITPIVSLIKFLEDSNIQSKCNAIYRFGEEESLEEQHAHKLNQVEFVGIKAGKRRRYWSIKALYQNFLGVVDLLDGFLTSLRYLKQYKIHVVFCKGGYVSLPVALAARFLGIDVLVHESDRIAGAANKIVAKFATLKFGGFPKNLGRTTIYTGQILSPDLLDYHESTFSLELGKLDTSKTIVLVMGGSQGARAIFGTLLTMLEEGETDDGMYFLVLLGTQNKAFQARLSRFPHVITFKYLSSRAIGYLYSISDVAITRGGATSLAEQQLFGLKKIIIPTPFTGSNHQLYNAERYQQKMRDKVIVQSPHLKHDLIGALDEFVGFKKEFDEPDEERIYEAHEKIFGSLEVLVNGK